MSKIEITLQDIFLALKRYLVWICLTTFLFTAGALVYAKFFITPMYSTTVSLCVFANQRTSEEVTSTQMAADARIAYTYEVLLTSQPVLEAVSASMDSAVSAGALKGMITASNVSGTQIIISIQFQSTSSARRTTCSSPKQSHFSAYFNPRPPRGGRLTNSCKNGGW